MNRRKIRILSIMALVTTQMLCPAFALGKPDADGTGGYEPVIVVNGSVFTFEKDEVAYDLNGTYLSRTALERGLKINIRQTGNEWSVWSGNDLLGKFQNGDQIKTDNGDWIPFVKRDKNNVAFIAYEGILKMFNGLAAAESELIAVTKTDSAEVKLMHITLPDRFVNRNAYFPANKKISNVKIDTCSNLNQSLNTVNGNVREIKAINTVLYAKYAQTMTLSLNDGLIHVTVSHKPSKEEMNLIAALFKDCMDTKNAIIASNEFERIVTDLYKTPYNNTYAKTLLSNETIDWYFVGEDLYYKMGYKATKEQNDIIFEFTLADSFKDTTQIN